MLREVIAAAFKSKGKRKMKSSELIYTMSFDLNWFTHEESRKVVEAAKQAGIIEGDEEISPAFDVDSVEVAPDFRPDAKKVLSTSFVDELITEIAEKAGKSYQEVVSMINAEQERVSNLLSFEVVTLLVAKGYDVDISRYLDTVEMSLFGSVPRKKTEDSESDETSLKID
jgi:hypothetical protein